jgi:hypothetical protein
MSKYPRIGGRERCDKNISAKCRCGEIGKYRVEIQTSWMRGDDEVVWACDKHKNDLDFLAEAIK